MSRVLKFQPLAAPSQSETQASWCKCRITTPRIYQQGDALFCHFCGCSKTLTPKVYLDWERVKKKLLEGGRLEYQTYTKDALIEMLISRDRQLFDELKSSSIKGELRLTYKNLKEQITAQVPYVVFKE